MFLPRSSWTRRDLSLLDFESRVLSLLVALPPLLPEILMEALASAVDPLRGFAKDSTRLVKRCHQPDRKGGFAHVGFVGFFVKLTFIPINNIIVGSG